MEPQEITAHMCANAVLHCQRALCREVQRLTADMLLEDGKPGAEGLTKPRVYEQSVPVPDEKGSGEPGGGIDFDGGEMEEGTVQFPFVNIKVDSVARKGVEEKRHVKLALIIGIYDSSPANSGHRAALNIAERVEARFMLDPVLDGRYVNDNEFTFEIAEQDTFAYTFGVLETGFWVDGIGRKEDMYT